MYQKFCEHNPVVSSYDYNNQFYFIYYFVYLVYIIIINYHYDNNK